MKHISAAAFSIDLHKRLRAIGYFQRDLAVELGLHPKVLSRKLLGYRDAFLTEVDVQRIISALAKLQVITTQDEAQHLLALAQLDSSSFSAQEWQTPPLSQLAGSNGQYNTCADSPLHNFPAPLTRLIGRDEAVKQLRQLLGQDEARLVTLVGTGGCGKTRLALRVANELAGVFAQGVWFVDLSAVSDPALVPQSIMQVLHIKSNPSSPALQSLTAYVQNKQLLLLLDNFEQVAAAAPVVDKLLAAAPNLKVLVTSRAVLRLYGETEFDVLPLDVPEVSAALDMAQLEQYGAVQLFIERARAFMPGITQIPENAASIAQICSRVDGLPLALELAAARVKILPPPQLQERLSQALLPVLTGGAKNLPDRQQTLRKTITWSYDLLSPSEQAWFARVGVFRGGWSLEAAEAMMQAVEANQRRSPQQHEETSVSESTLDLIERLLDNSLLVRLPVKAGQARFKLLETLREYALEQLTARGELERVQDWHCCYYLRLAEAAELGLRGAQQLLWQERLVAEQDNLRAALEWSLQQASAGAGTTINDPAHLVSSLTRKAAGNSTRSPATVHGDELLAIEVALRLTASLRPYWEWQGHLVEGRRWFDAVLALPLADDARKTACPARAKALSEAARLVCLQNEQSRAVELAEESIALWRQLDNPRGLATALFYRGWTAHALGDYELANEVYEEGLQLLSSADDTWLRAQLLFYLGAVAGFTFNFEQMRAYYAQSRALFEQVGDKSAIADVLKDQGGMSILEGNYTEAIANLLQSIELSHQIGYKQFVATGIGLLGFAVGMRGEPDPPSASLQSAQLWGAKDSLMGSIGSSSWLKSFPVAQAMIHHISSRVDETSWQAACLAGRSLTEEQAVAYCLTLKAANPAP